MTIRPAQLTDADEVVNLVLLAIKDIANQLTGESEPKKVLNQLKQFYITNGNRFSYSLIQVLEYDKKIVGMILCYDGKDTPLLYEPINHHLYMKNVSPTQDKEAEEDEYYIDAIAVHPIYQGKGYAKQLLSAAEKYAVNHHFSKLALNVDQLNDKALALYTQLGYKTDKVIYIHNRPYWHMVKYLK